MNKAILLFGGKSDERFVSVASAQNLATQYSFDELWYIFETNQICKVDLNTLKSHQNPFKSKFLPQNPHFTDSIQNAIPYLKDKTVFIGLHGTEGEDGTIQKLFETEKIAFTGSGSKSSQICFQKHLAKEILQKVNIKGAPQIIIDIKNDLDFESKIFSFLEQNNKIVIKPVANGSSIGLEIVADKKALEQSIINLNKSNQSHFLLEKFIKGRELTITIINHRSKDIALPPSEVLTTEGSAFDYDGKYLGKNTTEITPAQITNEQKQKAQLLALKAHQELGCYGYSRTDVILTESELYFLETNTLPGMTKASFVPQQLAVENILLKDFLQEQLKLAQARY